MAASFSFVQVDAFTDEPFSGNPAAICVLASAQPDRWYQAVAAEMNVSETAFLVPDGDVWSLRWFSPTVEVDLCGHATLASAHTLWSSGRADGPLRFATRSGELGAVQDGTGIRLDFPSLPPLERPPNPGLLESLGVAIADVRWVGAAGTMWVIELATQEMVAALRPDFGALRRVEGQIFIATAAGGEGGDVVCRCFGPAVGINEDPVTGSAHCVLGPFWAPRLGRDRLRSHQISARGGWVGVEVKDERITLIGRAVTVIEGTILA
jgi:predicted PhzF superfamily epimerase YddE/YHI9